MDIFAIAGLKNGWLAARHAVVAENIANASTPGYRAKAIAPFEASFESSMLQLARTNGAHLTGGGAAEAAFDIAPARADTVSHSDNSVVIENELAAGSSNRSQAALGAAVLKSFHRFYIESLKS